MVTDESNFTGAKRGGYYYTATLLLYLVLSFATIFLLELFGAGKTVSRAIGSLVSVAVFFLFSFIYAKKDVRKLNLNKFSPAFILPTLLLVVGMVLGLGFINTLISRGVESIGGKVADIDIPLDNAFHFLLFSVTLCLLPAVAEELFFRGVLLNCLSETKIMVRVVTVALCFALYHGNLSQFAYQFVYGAGLCILTLTAKSVIPAMAAHFINNFFALSTVYFNFEIDFFNPLFILVGALALALFILFLRFYRKGDKLKSGSEKIKDFYLPFGAVGVAVAVLIIVLSAIHF